MYSLDEVRAVDPEIAQAIVDEYNEQINVTKATSGGDVGRFHVWLGSSRRRPEELRQTGPAYQTQAPRPGRRPVNEAKIE